MLELTTKWMTNTLAKKSIQTNDFIKCENEKQLFIVGYGNITSGGKNTYNYVVKDASTQIIIEEGNDAYLDKLTTIIKSSSPKAKESKNESAKIKASYEIDFVTLQAKYESAKAKFEEFCAKHGIKTQEDAKRKDEDARDAKRKEHQEERRSEVKLLSRLQTLRKWCKDTKRVELLQKLSDKMLEI